MTVYRPAIFASAFHPHVGGVEELVRQLSHEQVRRGSSPLVVTNRYPKDLPQQDSVEGIPVRRYAFRVPELTARQMGGWALFAAATQRRVVEAVAAHRADVIHVQCVSSNGRYALAAAKRLNLGLVVSLQGELSMDATAVYERSRQLRHSWHELLEAADVVTACSRYVLEEAEGAFGQPFGSRGRVIYNGINSRDFDGPQPEAPRRPFVLGIGRMVEQKGFDLLIRGFERAARDEVDLVLAGEGPTRPALEGLAKELGVADRVHFVGRVDHGRAVSLFRQASVFVLPSRHEPQGIVVLEAMAAGTAVIASHVGGVAEIVKDEMNGLLYEPEDIDCLAVHLREVLDSPALAARLTAAAGGTSRQFSWGALTEQYDECYRLAVRSVQ